MSQSRAPKTMRARGLLIAGLLVAACRAGDDRADRGPVPTIEEIRAATLAQRGVRIVGTRSQGDRSGELRAAFARDPDVGVLTLPVFPVGGAPVSIEVRLVGEHAYVRRAPVPEPLRAATSAPLDRIGLRSAAEHPWLRLRRDRLALLPALALADPAKLLALVGRRDASLERVARAGSGEEELAVKGRKSLAAIGAIEARLWVDEAKRLRRVRMQGVETLDYTVAALETPLGVAAPPEAEVTTTLAPPDRAKQPEPAGDFVEVAAGERDGVAWRLSRAPESRGGTCWRFETVPPSTPLDDRRPACFGPPRVKGRPALTVEFPFVARPGSPTDALVAVAPGGLREASFGFADGTTAPALFTDSAGGVALWVGPWKPTLGTLALTLPGGVRAACGPGTVSTVADLEDLDEVELAELRTWPWACVARD